MSALKALLAIMGSVPQSSGGGSGLSGTTLNPSDKGGTGGVPTLSGGNLIASAGAGTVGTVRATNPLSTGKYYFECVFDSVGGTTAGAVCFGLANISQDIANPLGDVNFGTTHNSVAAYNDKGIYIENASHAGTSTLAANDGDVLSCAVDLTAAEVWFRNMTQDNVWNIGNSEADPATGVGGVDISGLGGSGTPLYPAVGFMFRSDTDPQAQIEFGDFGFTGTIPSGFHAWDSPL